MYFRKPLPAPPDLRRPLPQACPAADTRVTKKLGPGAPGTRGLAERYGDALVCVRYRAHADGRRYTTVEPVVEERRREPADALVRIAYGEADLRRRAREAGGEWLPDRKLWRLPRAAIRALGLQERVVPENA